jgi:hypothetical protein
MEAIMGFETRNLIFRVTMAAFVSVVAIFVIHVAAAYPQEAEISRRTPPAAVTKTLSQMKQRSSVTISSSGAIF